jgi:hypothetical protein
VFRLRRSFRIFGLLFLIALALPSLTGTVLGLARGWPDSWRTAEWSSSGLLPEAASVEEARVMILAARTGRWKSIFAEHTWIVLKPKRGDHWTRFDVVGWGDPVRRDVHAADALWYGNRPYVVLEISGDAAEALIPRIEHAIARYPYASRGDYHVWPGPNSNSFVAWVVRDVKGFDTELPVVAVGKDYLGPGIGFTRAASGTGWVLSLYGFFGVTVALSEGLEINILGTALGIDFDDLAIVLPALGKLGLRG